MGFWDKVLAPSEPPAPPARDAAPRDAWWAAPRLAPHEPAQPAAQPAVSEQEAAARSMQRAQWTKNQLTCPECGSGSYIKPGPQHAARCYNCGYPVLHSTSGASIPSDAGEATPARQLEASRKGDYRPGHIIGRIK